MGLINHRYIGLTGPVASGKGTVALILQKQGYVIFTFSDILREEAVRRNLNPNRPNLQTIGNELRGTYGDGVLATLLREKAALLPPETRGVVFDGIRHPAEIVALREKGVYIAGINAPMNVRYAHYRARKREGDRMVRKEFNRLDKKERRGEGGEHGQNVYACLKMADEIIVNDGTVEDLRMKLGLPPTTVEGQINNDPQRRK